MDPDDDDDSLAARIFKDFQNVIHKQLDEYAIIPTQEQLLNKCPLLVIDKKLGIESWCLEPLFRYVVTKLFQLKFKLNHELDDVSRVLLMLNPDYATAWNVRRQLFLQNQTTIIQELKFSELLLKREAKCPDNFSFRQFLLKQLQKNTGRISDQIVMHEMELALESAGTYHRNYNAWSHRIWVFNNLISDPDDEYVINRELDTVQLWIQSHVSEYSAFHYRQLLILKLKNDVLPSRLLAELELLDELMNVFPGRESLFLHRRFVVKTFTNNGTNCIPKEKEFIKCQKEKSSRDESHLFWIQRHQKWLQYFFKSSF